MYSTRIYVGCHVVGNVRGEVFYKRLKASKHFLRVPPAISLDAKSLIDAENAGSSMVEIVDVESGNKYNASIAEIRENGFIIDRGHGRQYALSLERWRRNNDPQQLTLI